MSRWSRCRDSVVNRRRPQQPGRRSLREPEKSARTPVHRPGGEEQERRPDERQSAQKEHEDQKANVPTAVIDRVRWASPVLSSSSASQKPTADAGDQEHAHADAHASRSAARP